MTKNRRGFCPSPCLLGHRCNLAIDLTNQLVIAFCDETDVVFDLLHSMKSTLLADVSGKTLQFFRAQDFVKANKMRQTPF